MTETTTVTLSVPAAQHRRLLACLAGEPVTPPVLLRLLDDWCTAQEQSADGPDPPACPESSGGGSDDPLYRAMEWILQHGDRAAMVPMVAMVAMLAPSAFLEAGRGAGPGSAVQVAAVDLGDAIERYLAGRLGAADRSFSAADRR